MKQKREILERERETGLTSWKGMHKMIMLNELFFREDDHSDKSAPRRCGWVMPRTYRHRW